MPRDSLGNYTLPATGNPILTGTAIASVWGNTTLNDIATEMADSLDRSGKGGMLAALKNIDGSVGIPSITFTNEPTSGFYRNAAGDVRFSLLGTNVFRITSQGLIATPGDVRLFGAAPAVDCTAAVTAAAAAQSNVVFPAGAWVITTLPTIPVGVNITVLPGATFTGVGAGLLGLANGAVTVSNQISDYNPPVGGELATFNIFRNPHYTGGPAGVNSGIRVQTNVGALVTNLEWAGTFIVNNLAAVGVGAQVAVYAQGNKGSAGVRAGPTWAFVGEARDKSGLGDPTDGLVSAELDIFADGGDANNRRIGLDIVGGIGVAAAPTIAYGVRIGPFNGLITNCLYLNGIYFTGSHTRAITISSTGAVGIDTTGATLSGASLRLAANQFVSFVVTDARTLGFVTGTGLAYQVNGVTKTTITDNGVLIVSAGAYTSTSSQVFTATPTFDARLSNIFEMGALTGNVTSVTITNPSGGQTITIRFKQDGVGGRTVASPAGSKIVGTMVPTASTAALLTLTYSVADTRWEGTWTQLPT